MSDLLQQALLIQSMKRGDRIKQIAAIPEPSCFIAKPIGFDEDSGLFKATAADGGEHFYQVGNWRQPTDQIILTKPKSGTAFGDWL